MKDLYLVIQSIAEQESMTDSVVSPVRARAKTSRSATRSSAPLPMMRKNSFSKLQRMPSMGALLNTSFNNLSVGSPEVKRAVRLKITLFI